MTSKLAISAFLLILILSGVAPARAAGQAVGAVEKVADGVIVRTPGGLLKLQVCADDVVRVAFAKDRGFFDRKSLSIQNNPGHTQFRVTTTAGEARVVTSKLQASVDLATGAVSFFDASGRPVLSEKKGGRELAPAEVQGENVFHARQAWDANADESLYGLGQHHQGLTDVKGYD